MAGRSLWIWSTSVFSCIWVYFIYTQMHLYVHEIYVYLYIHTSHWVKLQPGINHFYFCAWQWLEVNLWVLPPVLSRAPTCGDTNLS